MGQLFHRASKLVSPAHDDASRQAKQTARVLTIMLDDEYALLHSRVGQGFRARGFRSVSDQLLIVLTVHDYQLTAQTAPSKV